ncbi:related to Arginyl-tRNA--protein transferase 1 [Saccharomycodes ludwigii]|uniref:arginyltransferase n=1 Tax=Saccharomycodes ludwigii TaxID=36035 RepID=A0A376B4I0_9ASCO|nr:related to Arginyl-tRNA--protein transferase 1 [Saccharomycodes ludwigii]
MELSDRVIISKPLYIKEPAKHCGYCKGMKDESFRSYFSLDSWYNLHNKNGRDDLDNLEFNNCTLGLQAELIPVEIYDELCNMGFRRSGNFLYKQDLLRNCCRLFTIRTTFEQCKLSKELKSCIKRFKKKMVTQQIPLPSRKQQRKQEAFDMMKELYEIEKYSDTFYTKFEPSVFSKAKYELFIKYQNQVHNDYKTSEESFKRFLCQSPFPEDVVAGTKEEWEELNNWQKTYEEEFIDCTVDSKIRKPFKRIGPVHECYYYNDKLIALGVLDFLPSGISSVYFIWDPDFHKLNLGKISALHELSLVELSKKNYYYLGYYIEDCTKMVYKKKFGGELLDVCNNQYVPLHIVGHMIQHGKFFVLSNRKGRGIVNKEQEGEEKGEDTYDDDEEEDEEDEEDHYELPINNKIKFDLNKPLINIAEKIYGEKEGLATHSANLSINKLMDYGIEYTPEIFNDLYKLKPLKLPIVLNNNNRFFDGGATDNDDNILTNNKMEDEESSEEEFFEEEDGDVPGYTKEIYSIPNVVPGLLPMWQILQIIESGEIDRLNNKLMIYNTRNGQVRLVRDFSKESKRTKRCICNVIRLLGLKITAKSLIII